MVGGTTMSDQDESTCEIPDFRLLIGASLPSEDELASGAPLPWNWSAMTRTEAKAMWARLDEFVRFLNGRYAWVETHTIPPCWFLHGAIVEELTTLWWSRWLAFNFRPDPSQAQSWHDYSLPGFLSRLAFWLGDAGMLGRCRAGEHKPRFGSALKPSDIAAWADRFDQAVGADIATRREETLAGLDLHDLYLPAEMQENETEP